MNSSLYYKISDRVSVTRTDHVCVYPRRTYRRQTRHNPYLLTSLTQHNNTKVDLNDNNEVINQSEQKPIENFPIEIKSETIINKNEDQVVIPNEYIQPNKKFKRRMIMNFVCEKCNQTFKTNNQLHTHSITCRVESKPK